MKRLVCLFVVVAVAVLVLAGCYGPDGRIRACPSGTFLDYNRNTCQAYP